MAKLYNNGSVIDIEMNVNNVKDSEGKSIAGKLSTIEEVPVETALETTDSYTNGFAKGVVNGQVAMESTSSTSLFFHTAAIPSGCGKIVLSNNVFATGKVVYILFDENMAPIHCEQNPQASGSGANITTIVTEFEGASYIGYNRRVTASGIAAYAVNYEYAINGENLKDESVTEPKLQDVPIGNVLWGKKWAVCGDSFSAQIFTGLGIADCKILTGKYAGKDKVYSYLIGNRNNMEIQDLAVSGRTLATPSDGTFTNALSNGYYQTIAADVDYITIYLGINDAHHAGQGDDGEDTSGYIGIGTINDADASTFYGAWNVVLTWLITNRPNAHIGIIVTNGSSTSYRDATIAIANKYGIPYIDLNGDERTPAMIRTCNPDIPSSVKSALIEKWKISATNQHPNMAAHEFESWFIEDFLRNI